MPEFLAMITAITICQVVIAGTWYILRLSTARQADIVTTVISSLRVYALNPQDRVTPIVVLVLSLGPAAYQIVSIDVYSDEVYRHTTCPSSSQACDL